ncbi:hypothetical protein BW730_16020 [Tessaracoccus aquimaris]|uniref:Stealth protein CR2 conserved region 2 domain-containing protein n=1 Tax=Tessaracoccus aquimaris TaxID=1332264 RepID=A0A1Q2CRT7_9ACTN|nr:hypothetical protein BW730_16020 [Tessaracoccus aquimaris]
MDRSNPRLKVVDHQDIFLDSTMLPSFNSNSIISNLHHIEGLSEHYIYFNDDVFLGRWVEPAQFFLGSGIALVSPANNRRRFGEARVEEEPHFNISRNIRSILQDAFGVTVSRAIKHTPHPQIRSLHYQMESRFREHYQSTWSHPFRHHDDIAADQLHHYYAQITGRAVPGQLKYSYINLMDETHSSRLSSILALRNRDVFCLNDAPTGGRPVPEDLVQHFLDGYFPVPSSFEVPE